MISNGFEFAEQIQDQDSSLELKCVIWNYQKKRKKHKEGVLKWDLCMKTERVFQMKVIDNTAFMVVFMYLFQSGFTQLFSPFVSSFRKTGKIASHDTTDHCLLQRSSSSGPCSCDFDLRVKKSKDKRILQSFESSRAESVIA